MISVENGEWIVDLDAMTCRNNCSNIVVVFEKQGESILAKIDYIPLITLRTWELTHEGSTNIRNIIMEAEDIFLKAYFENELETNGLPEDILRDIEEERLN
ncbi:MAG: hypothetical protein LBI14_01060 [Treponema sp.]|nr:hypothetical protein [Treponema sp.]